MTDPDLPKRRRARRVEDTIGGLLCGSNKQYDFDVTCPVCKRPRRVRWTYFWRFPRPQKTAASLVRRISGLLRTLPDFLIIGAAKSGTTSLYGLITAHPDVLAARTKETHYFNFQHNVWMGMWWYRGHFPSILKKRYIAKRRGRRVLSGEASPSYLSSHTTPARIRAALPDARLIVILRNAVDRAYSRYNQNLRTQRESLAFEDAIAAEEDMRRYVAKKAASYSRLRAGGAGRPPPRPLRNMRNMWLRDIGSFLRNGNIARRDSYLSEGRYAEHLARWLDHFDRDRLLVLTLEELEADRQGVMDRVWEFLGLEPFGVGSIGTVRDSSWTRSFGAGRLLGADTGMLNVGSYPEMNPDTRRMLVDYFRPHNERLSRLLGRDFGWDR